MSYINSYGVTAGPIKINKTWINTIIDNKLTLESFTTGEDGTKISTQKETLYCTFSNKNPFSVEEAEVYRPLLAGTPIIGTYEDTTEDGSTVLKSFAPGNAVATVQWVMAYATLAPGTLGFDPADFVQASQFGILVDRVTALEDTTELLISTTETHTEQIAHLQQDVITNTTDIATNATHITKIHNWIVGNTDENYSEQYPTKFILKCGSASSFANR